MPELPDVETFGRYLNQVAAGHRIEDVQVHASRIVHATSPRELTRRLRGLRLTHSRRHGKLLFVPLDGQGHLVIHFGMTGFLHHSKDPTIHSAHARLTLDLDDGSHLDYDDQRMFGHVELVDDAAQFLRAAQLGPDALGIAPEQFVARLQQRKGGIKAALMDQSLVAGLGNVYADEVLFHARIHPQTPLAQLDQPMLLRLHRDMKHVLERAIAAGAVPGRLPRGWLLPLRGKADARCPRCGTRLQRVKIQQRSSWFCPRCQPRP